MKPNHHHLSLGMRSRAPALVFTARSRNPLRSLNEWKRALTVTSVTPASTVTTLSLRITEARPRLGTYSPKPFKNNFFKNHPCRHGRMCKLLTNKMIILYNDRPDRHKMTLERHKKVLRQSLKGIKTNLQSIALELIFCCFCLAEICSAKVKDMLCPSESYTQ